MRKNQDFPHEYCFFSRRFAPECFSLLISTLIPPPLLLKFPQSTSKTSKFPQSTSKIFRHSGREKKTITSAIETIFLHLCTYPLPDRSRFCRRTGRVSSYARSILGSSALVINTRENTQPSLILSFPIRKYCLKHYGEISTEFLFRSRVVSPVRT